MSIPDMSIPDIERPDDPFRVNPSGKRLIDEMREFAALLDPDLGPCFGRDVVRVLDALEAQLGDTQKRIEELERERNALAFACDVEASLYALALEKWCLGCQARAALTTDQKEAE